jgi:hypothetical protein
MKFCPTCETRYDEEILRFCTKDGTPLVDENQPNFTASGEVSEAEAMDFGEDTVIRIPDAPKPAPEPEIHRSDAPRIVIPTTEERREERVRGRSVPPYQPLPPKPNTAKVVVLTVVGTLAVLGLGFGLFYLLGNEEPAANTNANVNTNPPNVNLAQNLNTNSLNLNFNTNFNIPSSNLNLNFNTNINANKSPSPTPKLSPSPSPSLSPTPTPDANLGGLPSNSTPPATPRPATPRPTGSPAANSATRPPTSPRPTGSPAN